MNRDRRLNWLKITQVMLGLNALIWLVLGVASLLRMSGGSTQPLFVFALMAIFMFGNAALLVVSAWLLGRRHTAAYLLALAVLLVNVVLTFTDQFGTIDLLTLLFDLLILAILLWKRAWFMSPTSRWAPRSSVPGPPGEG